MKKIVLALMLISFGVGEVSTAQTSAAKVKQKGPIFQFKGGDTHDFGKVKKGPIVKYRFEFTNTGSEPIIIKDVNPSCGCTNVDWKKEPISPGKKGFIDVGLRTAEQHGAFFKDVYIQSNAANAAADKRYTIHIKGEAIEDGKKEEVKIQPKK